MPRPKGSPNKVNGQVKEMVLQALSEVGGVEYLKARAIDEPKAFLTLVGKVLPLQVTGADGAPLVQAVTVHLVGSSDGNS